MVETRTGRAKRITGWKWQEVESAEDVFIDILSRLPAKSLLSCKAVSRYWYDLIGSAALVDMHFGRSNRTPIYVVCPRHDEVLRLYLMKPGEMICRHLFSIPKPANTGNLYMLCSFSGLICCISRVLDEANNAALHDLEIRICNPATREILVLPQGSPSFGIEPRIGVAYGPDFREYKVFRIFGTENEDTEAHGGAAACKESEEPEDFDGSGRTQRYECEVYSSSTGSWRNIGRVPQIPMRIAYGPYASGHVFVRGKIYWLVALPDDHEIPGSILSVDMEGNFRVINAPDYGENLHEDDNISRLTFLIDIQGSLSLLVLHAFVMDIWVLKEENGEPTWELDRIDKVLFWDHEFIQFVTAWNNELLFATEEYWCTYNLDTKMWKGWGNANASNVLRSPVAFLYTESLLPCNGVLNP